MSTVSESLKGDNDAYTIKDDQNKQLPPKPEEPKDTDCCGSGCTKCVFDIYNEEIKLWEKECERIMNGEHLEQNKESVLCKEEYNPFKIIDVTAVNEDTFLYKFELPGNGTLGLAPSQHIIARLCTEKQQLVRQYTPVSYFNAIGYFLVVIKIYKNGKFTQLVKNWKVGEYIDWRGPFGDYIYRPNSYSYVLLLAAGTGITPLIHVIRQIVENEDDETFVRLFYSCKNYSQILLKDEIDSFKAYWNFSVSYFLTQDHNNMQSKYGENRCYSSIKKETLDSLMPNSSDNLHVLICGTTSFNGDMQRLFEDEYGVQKNQIHCF